MIQSCSNARPHRGWSSIILDYQRYQCLLFSRQLRPSTDHDRRELSSPSPGLDGMVEKLGIFSAGLLLKTLSPIGIGPNPIDDAGTFGAVSQQRDRLCRNAASRARRRLDRNTLIS